MPRTQGCEHLPYKCEYFAADAELSCFLVGNNALVRGHDRDTETAEDLRHLFAVRVDTQARLGDSLQACDDLFIFILASPGGVIHGVAFTLSASQKARQLPQGSRGRHNIIQRSVFTSLPPAGKMFA